MRSGSRWRRPCSGTARWASSSGRDSPRARTRSPGRSPTRTRTRSWAGATRSGRSRRQAWRTESTGSRPAEVHRWSCSRARSCRAWRRSHRTKRRIRPVLIAGNWKMYKGAEETAAFCRELRDQLEWVDGVDVAVCPPFLSLHAAVQALAGTDVAVAAQNVHWEAEGPYTGEISVPMLFELGVYGAIVGHSERRQHFGETDETVAKRVDAALEHGLSVIACVGETEAEREAGETEAVLRRQVSVLHEDDNLVLAYEPVWAIGTGKTATPELAQEAHSLLKSLLDLPVLYGGSV